MPSNINDSLFSQYGTLISTQQTKKMGTIPFKNHFHLPTLVDILSRKQSHHVLLCTEFSANFHFYFLEALMQHLNHDYIPSHLRNVDLVYLDVKKLIAISPKQKSLDKEFLKLIESLTSSQAYHLFVLSSTDVLFMNSKLDEDVFLQQQFNTLLAHPQCRFIFMHSKTNMQHREHSHSFHQQFTTVTLTKPSEADIMLILKLQRIELENFHRVVIPDELLNYAYSLAERYLSPQNALEKTLLLLDSCAARATITEPSDNNRSTKPVMSISALTSVVSGWTQIPATNLLLHKFKYSEFMHGMQQKVLGQEAAITLLSHVLQQTHSHLHQNNRPFCSLLFAGPEHSGKNTAAIVLTEQLFKQTNALYFVQPTLQPHHSILDIKLHRYHDKQCISLKDLVEQIPYAVILFEQIEQASAIVLDELQEILSTGYLYDTQGHAFNFRQMTLLLTTTLGSSQLAEIEKSSMLHEEASTMDLLQLVTREQTHGAFSVHHYSPQEIADEITTTILNTLPPALCEYLHVVPFIPLSKSVIEKIIQLKLTLLGKELDSRYGIELSYAPEVLRYLTSERFKKETSDHKTVDIEKALKQLNFAIEQAILSQIDNKNRSNQLFLQLNESGQVLRCDWLTTAATGRKHAVSSPAPF